MQLTVTLTIPTGWRLWRWLVLAGLFVLAAVPLATPRGSDAAFPGANGLLAFTTTRDGNDEIYTMTSGGASQTNITNNAASDDNAQWSSDGTKLVFDSNRDGNCEIYTMNANGTGQTRLTTNAVADGNPALSPDGTKIAFTRNTVGGNPPTSDEIYVMNADGTGQVRLTNNTLQDNNAVWSPDGAKILFNSARDGDHEIFVMNPDGTGATKLTINTALDNVPDWSPDGTKIVFRSDRNGNAEIYVMNADGTAQTRLTTNAATDTNPAFSPDGTKIAFHSNRDGNFEIYTMNPDGTGQTRITNNAASDISPNWQPGNPLGPYAATITNTGLYALPKSCFEVRDAIQTPLFQVCDNDFAGAPEADAACAGDGICDDQAPALGTVTVLLAGSDYRVVETTVAPNHALNADKEVCNNLAGACAVSFSSAPNTKPWFPWDVTGDGFVAGTDFFALLARFGQSKP